MTSGGERRKQASLCTESIKNTSVETGGQPPDMQGDVCQCVSVFLGNKVVSQ